MKNYIMALDQGTTSSRCILFNRQGQAVSKAQKEFKQIYPVAGWVEQDPKEIWSSQISVAAEAMAKLGISAEDIASIGITNQRETTILWNKLTGEPVYNAIVWQCRRTSDMIQNIKASGLDRVIKEHTGLIPDAYFSATKIKWIFDNVEGVKEEAEKGNILFGTVDTWLIWKLTGGKVFATDYTNASRTMLFDIKRLIWDEEILNALDIPMSILPEVKPSSHIFGLTEKGLLGGKITIGGVAGDQQAALFGQGCYEKGEVKNTYGTGCFLLMNTGDTPITSDNGLLTTIAASSEKGKVQYALEGSVFVAGAAIQWLRDELQIIRAAAETEEAALSVKDTNGVYVVPAFSGLGAPYWDQYARGTIVGMTRGFNKNHLIRATLESIAYQNYAVLKAMEQDAGVEIKRLKADGGASSNNFLMKFQADILGIEVIRPSYVETTALGAAYLAGLAAGFWKDREEIKSNGIAPEIFSPDMEETIRANKLQGWNKAVKRSFEWEKESD
jgi:glycerol kinase